MSSPLLTPNRIDYDNLHALYKYKGPKATCRLLKESLDKGSVAPTDFRLRKMGEAFVGREWVESLIDPSGGYQLLTEAPVDLTTFKNITGQIVYRQVLQGWEYADAGVMERLARVVPTNLSGEKIAGIGKIVATEGYEVRAGHPYPTAGLSEHWIETPETTKKGLIVEILKEDVYFDRTGQVLERASDVGEVLSIDKLERMLKVVLGLVNNHNWKGTAYDTYQSSTPWINVKTSQALVDWTSIEAARLVLAGNTHPDTGKPIVMRGTDLLVMPAKEWTAKNIVGASEIRTATQSAAQTLIAGNPLAGSVKMPLASQFAYALNVASGVSAANTNNTWVYGDFLKAFSYRQNWPITVVQAPANNEAEFTRDVTARFKASERGVMAVMEPRAVCKVTNDS